MHKLETVVVRNMRIGGILMDNFQPVACNECEHTENEGGDSFNYCDNSDSKYYGDCVENAILCCKYFKQK